MANSIVITGGNARERIKNAEEIAKSQSSPFDISVFDTTDARGIALSKEIIQIASRRPFEGQVSSILILEAQSLTIEAQNALLKTLEEPTESSALILTAPTTDSLLPTIASRCSEIVLESASESESKTDLAQDLTFAKKLETIFWEKKLNQTLRNDGTKKQIQQLHRYNKTLLKLRKAEGLSVNKKLLTLIAALETPNET
jgi:DNA polymerase III delta prime subunit